MADINITDRTEKYEELIPSEDLKKEYHEFLEKHWFNQPGKRTISEQMFFTALYFANWQKQKMLKTAIDATVHIEAKNNCEYLEEDPIQLGKAFIRYEDKEKVKIIIVGQDD